MNGNITKEGITADLESMRRVGINGVEIFNVSEQIPDGPAPFMSPQWLELFRFAGAEADRLGIEVCFHNCAGWSSSGGPWIKPEYAMQTLVSSELKVSGGQRFKASLPKPQAKAGYYRDIAVLAFPTPKEDARIDKLESKGLFGFSYEYGQLPDAKSVSADAVVPRDRIVDLTSHLKSNGQLTWDVPAGEWTILRIGHTPTGKENAPSPVAGRGLEVDKLSRKAMDTHWGRRHQAHPQKARPAGRQIGQRLPHRQLRSRLQQLDPQVPRGVHQTPRLRSHPLPPRAHRPLRGQRRGLRTVPVGFPEDHRRPVRRQLLLLFQRALPQAQAHGLHGTL